MFTGSGKTCKIALLFTLETDQKENVQIFTSYSMTPLIRAPFIRERPQFAMGAWTPNFSVKYRHIWWNLVNLYVNLKE